MIWIVLYGAGVLLAMLVWLAVTAVLFLIAIDPAFPNWMRIVAGVLAIAAGAGAIALTT